MMAPRGPIHCQRLETGGLHKRVALLKRIAERPNVLFTAILLKSRIVESTKTELRNRNDTLCLTKSLKAVLTLAMPALLRANTARRLACKNQTSRRWRSVSNWTGTARIFAAWRRSSCHAAHRMRRRSARSVLKFARPAVMSAPSTNRRIARNVRQPVTSALKIAERWRSIRLTPSFGRKKGIIDL